MNSAESQAAVANSSTTPDPHSLASDGERRRFFRRHEDLRTLETVEQLCLEASRQLWVDVEKAGHLVATARWLARELAAEADAGLWLARSTRIAANVQHRAGDSKAAQELYGEALERFLALGEDKEAAITRSSALLNLAYLGDYDTVFQWEQAAREVFERVSDRLRLAILEHNFANILTRQDRWREALAHYQAAYEEFLQLERPQDVAVCLRNVAVCHINLFHFGEALAVHQENRAWC